MFCSACGARIAKRVHNPTMSLASHHATSPFSTHATPVLDSQTYFNKKIKIAVAIIVPVLIVAIVIIANLSIGQDSQLSGTWETTMYGERRVYEFSDDTYRIYSGDADNLVLIHEGTYSLSENEIVFYGDLNNEVHIATFQVDGTRVFIDNIEFTRIGRRDPLAQPPIEQSESRASTPRPGKEPRDENQLSGTYSLMSLENCPSRLLCMFEIYQGNVVIATVELRFSGNVVAHTATYNFRDFETFLNTGGLYDEFFPPMSVEERRIASQERIERLRALYEEMVTHYQNIGEVRGTYSITDGTIEFIWDDVSPLTGLSFNVFEPLIGQRIDVLEFSKTENTITIDGRRYDLQR